MIEIKVSASVLLNAYRDPAETTWLHTTFRTDDCIDKPPPSGAKNRVNAPANSLLRKIIDAVLFQVTRGILWRESGPVKRKWGVRVVVSSTDRKRIHRLLLAEMKKHPREGNDNRDCLGARLSVEEKARLKDLSLIRQTSVSALIRDAVRDKWLK